MNWELPPRPRGRPTARSANVPRAGATPASAGTTPWRRTRSRAGRSYPRERGDDRSCGDASGPGSELPPRARGRPPDWRCWALRFRATPASAGTTRCRGGCVRAGGSYPRERGDDERMAPTSTRYRELPPRARGRPRRGLLGAGVPGATPASAGTTSRRTVICMIRRSYRRERGDDLEERAADDADRELPPRARGRRRRPCVHPDRAGATPASAGTTWDKQLRDSAGTSYPRERGDDVVWTVFPDFSLELPPRARGRPFVTCDVTGPDGQIESVRRSRRDASGRVLRCVLPNAVRCSLVRS